MGCEALGSLPWRAAEFVAARMLGPVPDLGHLLRQRAVIVVAADLAVTRGTVVEQAADSATDSECSAAGRSFEWCFADFGSPSFVAAATSSIEELGSSC